MSKGNDTSGEPSLDRDVQSLFGISLPAISPIKKAQKLETKPLGKPKESEDPPS